MKQIFINKVSDLTSAIEDTRSEYTGPLWFRGHAMQSWNLLPSYYRTEHKVSEHSLLIRFRQSATMLTERIPESSFDWMFLMQHYGVPTRLLDWSESPLVALYFCVFADNNEDGGIWILKPAELNKIANINPKDEEIYIPSFQDEELQTYTIESLRANPRVGLKPVATIASRNNPRIQAQLGAFTVHHRDAEHIETLGDASHVIKLLVPKDSKENLKRELNLLGFNRFQLFPELASVGEMLKDELK